MMKIHLEKKQNIILPFTKVFLGCFRSKVEVFINIFV